MVEVPDERFKGGGWQIRSVVGWRETMRRQNQGPWRGAGRQSFGEAVQKVAL
jgi:hypothetical protein